MEGVTRRPLPTEGMPELFFGEAIVKSSSEQQNLTEKALLKTLLLSLFSILFAMVCLVGLTYAWFSAHVAGGVTTMTAANFSVQEVQVNPPISGGTSEPQGDTYVLTATEDGAAFTVQIAARGEATQGYFSITFSTQGAEAKSFSFSTEPVAPGGAFSFTLTVDGAPMSEGEVQLTLSVRAAWGNAPAGESLKNGSGLTFDGTEFTIIAPSAP